MNCHVSITQLQQLSVHGLSCIIYVTTHLSTVMPDYFKAGHYDDVIYLQLFQLLLSINNLSMYL